MYTLVMHSGAGWGGKPGFARAVEEMAVETKSQRDKVKAAGGLLLETYGEAADRAEAENYPPEVQGLYPRVRGRFSRFSVRGLRIYVPAAEAST